MFNTLSTQDRLATLGGDEVVSGTRAREETREAIPEDANQGAYNARATNED
jgi:hypothetical protein